jgi:hypothetical protein
MFHSRAAPLPPTQASTCAERATSELSPTPSASRITTGKLDRWKARTAAPTSDAAATMKTAGAAAHAAAEPSTGASAPVAQTQTELKGVTEGTPRPVSLFGFAYPVALAPPTPAATIPPPASAAPTKEQLNWRETQQQMHDQMMRRNDAARGGEIAVTAVEGAPKGRFVIDAP